MKIVVANEVKMFWRICQDFRSADPVISGEAIDEMEVLQVYTDSDTLRDQCSKMLAVMRARVSGVERRAQA